MMTAQYACRLREAEEARRAAELGPVPIRVHFPDGLVLQAQPPSVLFPAFCCPWDVHAVMPLALTAFCRPWGVHGVLASGLDTCGTQSSLQGLHHDDPAIAAVSC